MKLLFSFFLILPFVLFGQDKTGQRLTAEMTNVTVFFNAAQIRHQSTFSGNSGKHWVVFEKLTDFLDPQTVQVKANGNVNILSIKVRKNYDDLTLSDSEMRKLNQAKDSVLVLIKKLQNENAILQHDRNLLEKNRDLKSPTEGLNVNELKETYSFFHTQLSAITKRQSAIRMELESLNKEQNRLEQELISQRSKPVKNHSEVWVELESSASFSISIELIYLSPNATWTPFYDWRSDGINKPVVLEMKANVQQTTGIEWKNVAVTLSTNDPYQNIQAPEIQPWYLDYYRQPPYYRQQERNIPLTDFSGETIRGQVMDAQTGEPLTFAKVYFPNYPDKLVVTDFNGKFEIVVPRGATQIQTQYIGYVEQTIPITAPYLKVFLYTNDNLVDLSKEKKKAEGKSVTITREDISRMPAIDVRELDEVVVVASRYSIASDNIEAPTYRLSKSKYKVARSEASSSEQDKFADLSGEVSESIKDLRVEYTIQSKMNIPSDDMEHRVFITKHEVTTRYEYHSVPKLDPAVYLSAQISGWEKLNLLNGEANIYFDGSFIGKTYFEAQSTKDTLSLSLGKDLKMSIERKRIKDVSKEQVLGKRKKVDVVWEISVRNNGAADLPLLIKDQLPLSTDTDIKVKQVDLSNGKFDEKTGIVTWQIEKGKQGTQRLKMHYQVDYNKEGSVLLE